MTDPKLEQQVRDALRLAFRFGETYWQQADSESHAQNRKAGETMARFKVWADEQAAARSQQRVVPPPFAIPDSIAGDLMQFERGWNACRAEMLAAALSPAMPAADPVKAALLEACKALYEELLRDHYGEGYEPDADEPMGVALAAIALAQGDAA